MFIVFCRECRAARTLRRGGRRPRGAGILGCLGKGGGSAGSQPLSRAGLGAAYGAGGDNERAIAAALSPAVHALTEAAASLKEDMKLEKAANAEFRKDLARDQRRVQRRLDAVDSGRRTDAKGSDDSGLGRSSLPGRRGLFGWFPGGVTCATLVFAILAIVGFIMYAALSDGWEPPGSSKARGGDKELDKLREQNKELLARLTETSLGPAILRRATEVRGDGQGGDKLKIDASVDVTPSTAASAELAGEGKKPDDTSFEPEIADTSMQKDVEGVSATPRSGADAGAAVTEEEAGAAEFESELNPLEDADIDAGFRAVDEAYAHVKEERERKRREGGGDEETSSDDAKDGVEDEAARNLVLRDSSRNLLHKAQTVVGELAKQTRWTDRSIAQLDRYDRKMTKLDEVLTAGRRAAALKRVEALKVSALGDEAPLKDPAPQEEEVEAVADGVSSEVKLGVEAVRQWEEKVAHNLTALHRRTEEALDALKGLKEAADTLGARGERAADANASAAITSLVEMLNARQQSLRQSLSGQAQLNARASRSLVALRGSILRVMSTIIDADEDPVRPPEEVVAETEEKQEVSPNDSESDTHSERTTRLKESMDAKSGDGEEKDVTAKVGKGKSVKAAMEAGAKGETVAAGESPAGSRSKSSKSPKKHADAVDDEKVGPIVSSSLPSGGSQGSVSAKRVHAKKNKREKSLMELAMSKERMATVEKFHNISSRYVGKGGYLVRKPRVTPTEPESSSTDVDVKGAPAAMKQVTEPAFARHRTVHDPMKHVHKQVHDAVEEREVVAAEGKELSDVFDKTVRDASATLESDDRRFGVKETGVHASGKTVPKEKPLTAKGSIAAAATKNTTSVASAKAEGVAETKHGASDQVRATEKYKDQSKSDTGGTPAKVKARRNQVRRAEAAPDRRQSPKIDSNTGSVAAAKKAADTAPVTAVPESHQAPTGVAVKATPIAPSPLPAEAAEKVDAATIPTVMDNSPVKTDIVERPIKTEEDSTFEDDPFELMALASEVVPPEDAYANGPVGTSATTATRQTAINVAVDPLVAGTVATDVPVGTAVTAVGGADVPVETAVTAVGGADVPVETAVTAAGGADVPLETAVTAAGGADVPVETAATAAGGADVPVETAATAAGGADVPVETAVTAAGGADVSVETAATAAGADDVSVETAVTAAGGADIPVKASGTGSLAAATYRSTTTDTTGASMTAAESATSAASAETAEEPDPAEDDGGFVSFDDMTDDLSASTASRDNPPTKPKHGKARRLPALGEEGGAQRLEDVFLTSSDTATTRPDSGNAPRLSALGEEKRPERLDRVIQLPALGSPQLGAAAHFGPWAGGHGFASRLGQFGGGGGTPRFGGGGAYYDAPYGGGFRGSAGGVAGGDDYGAADLGYDPAWAASMSQKLEAAQASATAAEEAGKAASEAAAEAAADATAKANKHVKAAQKARIKAEKALEAVEKERDVAVKSAERAKREATAAAAKAAAAEALLRNESARAMDEIQAARDAIAAESKRSSAAESRARAAELALPKKVEALATKKADDRVRRVKASAAAVRGAIEREVGEELQLAQSQIDAARRDAMVAAAARDEAAQRAQALAAEKDAAIVAARDALREKEAAQAELERLLSQRGASGHAVRASTTPPEHVLENEPDVTENAAGKNTAGVAAPERARTEARVTKAESGAEEAVNAKHSASTASRAAAEARSVQKRVKWAEAVEAARQEKEATATAAQAKERPDEKENVETLDKEEVAAAREDGDEEEQAGIHAGARKHTSTMAAENEEVEKALAALDAPPSVSLMSLMDEVEKERSAVASPRRAARKGVSAVGGKTREARVEEVRGERGDGGTSRGGGAEAGKKVKGFKAKTAARDEDAPPSRWFSPRATSSRVSSGGRMIRATLGLRHVPSFSFGDPERAILTAGLLSLMDAAAPNACDGDRVVLDAGTEVDSAAASKGLAGTKRGKRSARRLAAMGSGGDIEGDVDLHVQMVCSGVPSPALARKAKGAVEWGISGGAFETELAKIGLRITDGIYLVRTEVVEP